MQHYILPIYILGYRKIKYNFKEAYTVNEYPHLFSSITIRGITYKNRIIAAPEGGAVLSGGELVPRIINRNIVLGRGNVGGILMGETAVSNRFARSSDEAIDFDDPAVFEKCSEYPKAIKKYGAVATVELGANGAMSAYNEQPHYPVKGPMEYDRDDGIHVYAMTEADVTELCDDFAHASKMMKRLGFDGVSLHAGHGWLFSQFLSPHTNQRADRFGGSLENRARISLMALDSMRRACGEDFIIECRVSGSLNVPGSYSLEDICGFSEMVAKYVDIIHVSAGYYRSPELTKMISTMYDAHGCNVEIAAAIKKASGVPVAVVGGINDPAFAEDIVASGKADFVAFARALRCDPAFILKAQSGRSNEIRKCVRCMGCYPGSKEEALDELGQEGVFSYMNSCSLNPYYPYSGFDPLPKAERTKTVLIVGGGVAGMQAAITASDRGHKVTLVEKEPELGGLIKYTRYDTDKYDLVHLIQTLKAEMKYREVDIHCSTVVDQLLISEIKPNVVIAAIGSSPIKPPIQGIDGANVIWGGDAYKPEANIGENVAVIGGGLVGCEAALHFAKMGKHVVGIEMVDQLAADAYRLHKKRLRQELKTKVRFHVNSKCVRILNEGVEVEKADATHEIIPADTVVYAVGQRGNTYDTIRELAADAEFHAIGDCVSARKIKNAIEEGYKTALDI